MNFSIYFYMFGKVDACVRLDLTEFADCVDACIGVLKCVKE